MPRSARLLLALAAFGSTARAQLPFQTHIQAFGAFQPPAVIHPCGSSATVLNAPGTIDVPCTAFDASYHWTASSQAGLTRGMASVSGNGLGPAAVQVFGTWSAGGNATWADRLVARGGQGTQLAITMAWDGTLSAGVSSNGELATASANASWGFDVEPTGSTPIVFYGKGAGAFADAGTTLQGATVNDVQTFLLPIGFFASYDMQWFVNTSAVIADGGPATPSGPGTFGASAVADLSHTGKIVGFRFLDAAGQDVTSSVSWQFLNGTQIYAASTVPEPALLPLVGAGLLALGTLVRHRTRA